MLKSWRIFSACLLLLLIVGSCSSLISQIKNLPILRTWPFLTTSYPSSGTAFWSSCCAQLCLTLCGHVDYSTPGPSVHGILQARILEWVAISYSKGSSQPRDWTHFSCISYIASRIFAAYATWEAPLEVILNHKTKKKTSTSLIFPLTFYYNWNLFLLSTSFFPGVFTSGDFVLVSIAGGTVCVLALHWCFPIISPFFLNCTSSEYNHSLIWLGFKL